MKTSYKPSKLPAIAAQVRKEHPTSSEIKNYQLDNSFLDEVRQWAKLPKEDVDGEAITIPIRKVRLLANYVPANSLHLPLLNLTRILFLRANEEIARSLFILWQDYFTNQDLCYLLCNGVQREHNKKLNNGLPILHKVPPKRDYGRYFCIMAEKGGTSHGGLTEKLSPFFHAKKQEVNAYGR